MCSYSNAELNERGDTAITALAKSAKRRKSSKTESTQLSNLALGLLEQMEADGITPDGFSFSSAISCCGAEGRWEEALSLIERMKNGGPRTRPNKVAFTAAICKMAQPLGEFS